MKKTLKITAFILSLLMLAACGQSAEVQADDEGDYVLTTPMSESTKAEIDTIVSTFETALSEKSAAKVMEHLDENFTVQEEDLTAFFTEATDKGRNKYEVFDTYYVNGIKDSDVSMRIKKTAEDGDYAMLTPGSDEICAVLFLSKNETVSQMITLLIARTGSDMKIVWIDTSDYDYYGKTAPEYYELAKKAKEEGKEYLAYVYAQMMLNICQPGNILYFKETNQITDFVNEMSSWGQDKYPMEIIDGEHKIHLIGLALEDVGVVPMLFYETKVDTKSAEFKKDAEKVKDAFLDKYPYLTDAFEKITLHATNEDAQNATQQSSYESITFDMK